MPNLVFATVGAFAAALLLAFVVADYALERRQALMTLRALPAIRLSPEQVRQQTLSQPMAQRIVIPAMIRLGQLVRRLTPRAILDRIGLLLVRGGSPPGWDAERLVIGKFGVGVAAGLAAVLVGHPFGLATVDVVVVAGLLAVGAFMAPDLVLRSRARQRQREIQRTLPDALDLLSITVSAGLGFDAALDRVSEQVGGPLGDELRRTLGEIRLGKTRAQALRDLAGRCNVGELRSFVVAMVQADAFGISIAHTLTLQAAEMRLKRRQRAQEVARKIPVKILFPVLLCIFPAIFVVLIGPAVIQLSRALLG